ncbi:hypothetical protein BJ508DRAFT_82249 [Ascobolus immersus RN42]|uniref:RING-type domain-containing protein n=1 Tax=Ascobolus immersus RN42 TaxID=1160509 RepID=A0A3N4HC98_ASCIM|nr:hypothetical protein BJ508DRAFT_82249 [Ascobolus immersus RN42]
MSTRSRHGRGTKGLARAVLDTIPIVSFTSAEDIAGPEHSILEYKANSSDSSIHHSQRPLTIQEADCINSPSALNSCAASVNSDFLAGAPQTQCPVCMEEFEKGQHLRVIPCKHSFHQACIDPWLLNVSGSCPLCRIDLRPEDARKSFEMPPPPPPGTQLNYPPRFLQYLEVYRTTAPNSTDRLMRLQAIDDQRRLRGGRSAVPEFGITRLRNYLKKKRSKAETPSTEAAQSNGQAE